MAKRKRDWFLPLVGFLVGGVVATVAVIAFAASPMYDRVSPAIQCSVSYFEPPQPGVPATLTVEVFGRWTFTQTAPTPNNLLIWSHLLSGVPAITAIAMGGTLGALGIVMVGRRFRRIIAQTD